MVEGEKEILNTKLKRIGRKKPFASLKSSSILNIYIFEAPLKITLGISIRVFYDKPLKFSNE